MRSGGGCLRVRSGMVCPRVVSKTLPDMAWHDIHCAIRKLCKGHPQKGVSYSIVREKPPAYGGSLKQERVIMISFLISLDFSKISGLLGWNYLFVRFYRPCTGYIHNMAVYYKFFLCHSCMLRETLVHNFTHWQCCGQGRCGLYPSCCLFRACALPHPVRKFLPFALTEPVMPVIVCLAPVHAAMPGNYV